MEGKSVAILEGLRSAIWDTMGFRRINRERCYKGLPGGSTIEPAALVGHHTLAILRQLLLQSSIAARKRASEHVRKFVSATLKVLLKSEKITDEIAVIEGNLRSWTAAGSRYHKICLRLDKGALFLLPQVSDNV